MKAHASAAVDERTAAHAGGEIDADSIRLLELRHRIKNLLAVVQAVANQTLRSGRTVEESRQALNGRLAAMGEAVDMLLRTAWSEGGLRELIERALVGETDRVVLDGPDLVLGPDAVMALSLVFHELESNSMKYGALSAAAGRVAIGWRVEDGRLSLTWEERDGPPCAPPLRQGFGSRMIAKLVGGRFRGKSETEYRADGLRWTLTAPLSGLAA
ncbi:MAG: HWE histidine kinase domain-containing protein [Allosphingosinicella sp.]